VKTDNINKFIENEEEVEEYSIDDEESHEDNKAVGDGLK
jgi:hypothetical protein